MYCTVHTATSTNCAQQMEHTGCLTSSTVVCWLQRWAAILLRWFPAPATQILFSGSPTLQLLYIGEERVGRGRGVFRGRANNNCRTQSRGLNQPLPTLENTFGFRLSTRELVQYTLRKLQLMLFKVEVTHSCCTLHTLP